MEWRIIGFRLVLVLAGFACFADGQDEVLTNSSEVERQRRRQERARVMRTILLLILPGAFFLDSEAGQEAAGACPNPIFVTSATNGGWSDGGYYVHNNMWNASLGETLCACAYNNWYVTATFPATTDVKTYPNVHKDINHLKGAKLSGYKAITSTFAATAPHTGIYDVAYDIWFNGVGWGKGTTELMIWTENCKQVPLGKKLVQADFDGVKYDAWHYTDRGANVITLVPVQEMTSGKLDLKGIFDWTISKGWMPADPTINQICFGVEICSTENRPAKFYFTDFSVRMN